MKVFPNEEAWRQGRTAPGEWSGVLQGTRSIVPRGGLTARALRQVRLDRSVWYCRELVDKIAKRTGRLDRPGQPEHGRSFTAYALARGGIRTTVMEPTPPEVRGRPSGRPRLVRREYERLARECRRLLLAGRQGRSLYQELARRLNLTASQVKDRLSRGRRYGYFPDLPTRGRSG